ncbi:MAG: DMT family transporter [Bacteroidetes bacterium]|nr:DMT family transporter [Bacteroidota bacterium]
MISRDKKAELLLLLITIIWGSTFVITKSSLDHASPLVFLGIRFSLAALVFGLIFHRQIFSSPFRLSGSSWVVILTLLAGFAFQTTGLKYTTASHSGFITGLLVILTPLFQVFIEKKAPGKGVWTGVVLVTIGLYLMISPDRLLDGDRMFGNVLTFICAISFALYIVYLDIATRKDNIWQLTFMQFAVTAAGSLLLAPMFEAPTVVMNQELIVSVVYLAILATIVTTFIQTRYQKDTTPAKAAVIFTMEPVFSAILAFMVLDERIGLAGIFGGIVIVIGLLISELWKERKK